MIFHFSHEELSFLAKRFGYKHLEGIEFIRYNKEICYSSLIEKGYMIPYKKSYELSNEVRLLFSTWISVKYTLVREGYLFDNDVFAIFANEERILSYSFHDGKIEIIMCDFSIPTMDSVIRDYLDIREDVVSGSNLNISFSGDDYLSLFGQGLSNADISRRTGLTTGDVELIKKTLSQEYTTSYILQDVDEDIGCMGTIFNFGGGYMLVKHVVPNKDLGKQKVVIVKGGAKDIIDSIYIL